jgi:hypothetical protein
LLAVYFPELRNAITRMSLKLLNCGTALKIWLPQGSVGSIPSTGTNDLHNFSATELFPQFRIVSAIRIETLSDTARGSDPNNFDGLRLFASLLVVVSHTFLLSDRHVPTFYGSHTLGNLGVLIFFSISGYLIAASWSCVVK